MRYAWGSEPEAKCKLHGWIGRGVCPGCQAPKAGSVTAGDGYATMIAKPVNYIATYQAECVDGNQVTANLSLSDVPEGTGAGSIIELITEQAYADIARSGMNATRVLVLNLSRVW